MKKYTIYSFCLPKSNPDEVNMLVMLLMFGSIGYKTQIKEFQIDLFGNGEGEKKSCHRLQIQFI